MSIRNHSRDTWCGQFHPHDQTDILVYLSFIFGKNYISIDTLIASLYWGKFNEKTFGK
ncbi:hypothetical protein [Gracilibacillus ureilyticus]|uniref:hypothetical protein n=1 Tax=Gracilibacillus ureilyticus TaxID=531814 RepID=UPI001587AB06|nr:hypothetical protein [Gracilibacillus ureilyticus]